MDLHALWYVLAALMVIVGLAGTILPALPGLPLVFGGMLLAAWADGFERVEWWWLLVLGALTALSMVIDFWATAAGAKRVGASRKAVVGAVVGTVAGLFFGPIGRSEEHTSELQSLMRISYAVFCLKKKQKTYT